MQEEFHSKAPKLNSNTKKSKLHVPKDKKSTLKLSPLKNSGLNFQNFDKIEKNTVYQQQISESNEVKENDEFIPTIDESLKVKIESECNKLILWITMSKQRQIDIRLFFKIIIILTTIATTYEIINNISKKNDYEVYDHKTFLRMFLGKKKNYELNSWPALTIDLKNQLYRISNLDDMVLQHTESKDLKIMLSIHKKTDIRNYEPNKDKLTDIIDLSEIKNGNYNDQWYNDKLSNSIQKNEDFVENVGNEADKKFIFQIDQKMTNLYFYSLKSQKSKFLCRKISYAIHYVFHIWNVEVQSKLHLEDCPKSTFDYLETQFLKNDIENYQSDANDRILLDKSYLLRNIPDNNVSQHEKNHSFYLLNYISFSLFSLLLNLIFTACLIAYVLLNLKLRRDYNNLASHVLTKGDKIWSIKKLKEQNYQLLDMKPLRFNIISYKMILLTARAISSLLTNLEGIIIIFFSHKKEYLYATYLSKQSYLQFSSISVFTSWILLIEAFSGINQDSTNFKRFVHHMIKGLIYCMYEQLPFFFAYLFAGMALFVHSKKFSNYSSSFQTQIAVIGGDEIQLFINDLKEVPFWGSLYSISFCLQWLICFNNTIAYVVSDSYKMNYDKKIYRLRSDSETLMINEDGREDANKLAQNGGYKMNDNDNIEIGGSANTEQKKVEFGECKTFFGEFGKRAKLIIEHYESNTENIVRNMNQDILDKKNEKELNLDEKGKDGSGDIEELEAGILFGEMMNDYVLIKINLLVKKIEDLQQKI